MRRVLVVLLVLVPLLIAAGFKKHVRVEDQMTDGAAGTVPVSDGVGGLTMTDAATQAELNAVTVWPDAFQGELAMLQELGYTADAIDLSGGAGYYMIPNVWSTEALDLLGNWRIRSQGEDADASPSISMDWRVDSLACWEPPYTHLMWLQKHCSGVGTSGSISYSPGRKCTIAANCEHASETCDAVTFDWDGQSPDVFTVTGHGFGTAGTVFGRPMGLERGGNQPPVSGYDVGSGAAKEYPSGCSMADGNTYWLKVVDADTFNLYLDDGDCDEETSGEDSTALDCTGNPGDWQALTLYAKESDCSDPVRYFKVDLNQNLQALDDTSPTGTLYAGLYLAKDRFEAVEDNDKIGPAMFTKFTEDNEYQGIHVSTSVAMSPGECLNAIGYVWGLGEFDDLDAGSASLVVTEAQRASPKRVDCPYSATTTVPASCMYHSIISNLGASGNIILTLPTFVAGMDFCATNAASGDHTLNLNPNASERFTAPATSAAGDSMQSVLQGETLCAIVLSDGTAQVTHNSGGWTDAD